VAPPPLRAYVPQAPPVLDALFARALAKDRTQRFATAIEMGEAFRAALGIPESPEWHAQAEIAHGATLFASAASAAAAEAPVETPVRAPRQAATARMATLREFLVDRYRTARM